MNYITVIELNGEKNFLFKIGERPDWTGTYAYHREIDVNGETVTLVATFPDVLRRCTFPVLRAYLEVQQRKLHATWYAVRDGYLLQTVIEFDEDAVPI